MREARWSDLGIYVRAERTLPAYTDSFLQELVRELGERERGKRGVSASCVMQQDQLSMRSDVSRAPRSAAELAVVFRNMADGRPSDSFRGFSPLTPDVRGFRKCRYVG